MCLNGSVANAPCQGFCLEITSNIKITVVCQVTLFSHYATRYRITYDLVPICYWLIRICRKFHYRRNYKIVVEPKGVAPSKILLAKQTPLLHSDHGPIKISFTHQSCLQASNLTTSLWISQLAHYNDFAVHALPWNRTISRRRNLTVVHIVITLKQIVTAAILHLASC